MSFSSDIFLMIYYNEGMHYIDAISCFSPVLTFVPCAHAHWICYPSERYFIPVMFAPDAARMIMIAVSTAVVAGIDKDEYTCG